MQPAIISGATAAPGQPEGWDVEKSGYVAALHIREEVADGGVPFMRSAWDASSNEIGLLLAGAKVHLAVAGRQHPVVNLSVGDLPDEFEPVIYARRFRCPTRGMVARVEAVFAKPPHGVRVWSEEPIVAGFALAFATALEDIEKRAKAEGLAL